MAKSKGIQKSSKCRHKWEKTSSHWEQVGKGTIAGFDVTSFTCSKCGATKEERNSRD